MGEGISLRAVNKIIYINQLIGGWFVKNHVISMSDEICNRARLLRKVSEFRKLLNASDLDDDAVFSNPRNPNQGYTYLSERKLKNAVKVLPPKVGLEAVLTFSDLTERGSIGGMTCHFTVTGTLTFLDIDTGEYISYVAFGEAGDAGDKAVRKAQTSALKSIFDNSFFVSDRVTEDDASDGGVSRAEAREEAIESLQDKAVDAPEPPQKATNDQAEAPAPVEAPKPQDAPKETVQERLDVGEPKPRNISPLQEKAIQRVLEAFTTAVSKGEKTVEDYNVIKTEADNIETASDAASFLKKWRA